MACMHPSGASRVTVVKVQVGWWHVCKSLIKMVECLTKGAEGFGPLPSTAAGAYEGQRQQLPVCEERRCY